MRLCCICAVEVSTEPQQERPTPHASRLTRADRATTPPSRGREQGAESREPPSRRAERAENRAGGRARAITYTHPHTEGRPSGRPFVVCHSLTAQERAHHRPRLTASQPHSLTASPPSSVERRAVAHRPPVATPSPRRATAPRTRSRAELGRGGPPRGGRG